MKKSLASLQEQTWGANSDQCFWRKRPIARRYGVSQRTIDAWMAAGVIPFVKIGHIVLFNINETDSALRRFRVSER